MAAKGKNPIRSKRLINEKILEQVSHFCYLECDVSFKFVKIIQKKLRRFQIITGTIGRALRRKTRKETQMSFHKVGCV